MTLPSYEAQASLTPSMELSSTIATHEDPVPDNPEASAPA